MLLWRIIAVRRADVAFTGDGAASFPGRWNHRDRRVVYASDSPALAALEILAHAETVSALRDRVAIRATVPDGEIYRLPPEDLPADWDANPIRPATRDLGEAWRSDGTFLGLAVPSAVMPLQENVILNPTHPAFGLVAIEAPIPIAFDPRLLGRRSA